MNFVGESDDVLVENWELERIFIQQMQKLTYKTKQATQTRTKLERKAKSKSKNIKKLKTVSEKYFSATFL